MLRNKVSNPGLCDIKGSFPLFFLSADWEFFSCRRCGGLVGLVAEQGEPPPQANAVGWLTPMQ